MLASLLCVSPAAAWCLSAVSRPAGSFYRQAARRPWLGRAASALESQPLSRNCEILCIKLYRIVLNGLALCRTCLNRIELERSQVTNKMDCVKINAAEVMICVQRQNFCCPLLDQLLILKELIESRAEGGRCR